MNGERRILGERPPSSAFSAAIDPKRQCGREIMLDGTRYCCLRDHVSGIHDAFIRHTDGGIVRW